MNLLDVLMLSVGGSVDNEIYNCSVLDLKETPVFVQGDCCTFIVSGVQEREDGIYLEVEEYGTKN